MRLEPLCMISMRYSHGSWHRPYGPGDAAEGLGFGRGEGAVSGLIERSLVWANYPRRRQDGPERPRLDLDPRWKRRAPFDPRPERR